MWVGLKKRRLPNQPEVNFLVCFGVMATALFQELSAPFPGEKALHEGDEVVVAADARLPNSNTDAAFHQRSHQQLPSQQAKAWAMMV